jgi:GNAT superfamily N-acetyltransferase
LADYLSKSRTAKTRVAGGRGSTAGGAGDPRRPPLPLGRRCACAAFTVCKRTRLYTQLSTPISVLAKFAAHALPQGPQIADSNDHSSLTVRAATPADAEPAVAIWNDAFVFSGTGGRRELYTPEDCLELLATVDLFVADREGVIEGTIAVVSYDGPAATIAGRGELELTHLAVARRLRRRGIARILLAWAHGEAFRRGAGALVLWSLPDQIEAHDLYLSLAYLRWPRRDLTTGADDDLHRMVYRLDLRQSGHSFAAMRSQ